MCYKIEVQKKNEEKLEQKLNNDKVPMFIRDYLEDIDSKAGALNYWSALKDFLSWLINDGKIINKNSISDITIEDFNNVYPQHISKYLRQKEEKGMSPTTLETKKNIIRSFLSNVGYYKESTIGDIKEFFKRVKYKGISSNNNLIVKLPTEEQLNNMEEKIANRGIGGGTTTRNLTIIKLLKGSGLRVSELVGLEIDDLFLDEDMPYVKIVGKGKYREIESRIVYLTNDATLSVKKWLEVRDRFVKGKDDKALFLTKTGKRLKEDEVGKMFKSASNSEVSPHMIRHWYATVMAQKAGVVFTQQQLGHTSMTTTINNYANGSYGMKDILASM